MSHPSTSLSPRVVVGLDVHVQRITLVASRAVGQVDPPLTLPNDPSRVLAQLRRIAAPSELEVCYEAGPTGYALARVLLQAGIACSIIAPSLIPRKPGDRIKTDRRDATKLAQRWRGNQLTTVAIPTPETEALRNLSRAREHAGKDLPTARQRLLKFLNQQGIQEPAGVGRWSVRFFTWLQHLRLDQVLDQLVLEEHLTQIQILTARRERLTRHLEAAAVVHPSAQMIDALMQLHGIGIVTAVGLVAEIGDLHRFRTADQLTADAGLVPREHSSGNAVRRGGITRTGNAHIRRLMVEAAWHSIRRVRESPPPEDALALLAWKARRFLHDLFYRLVARGKPRDVAIVAVARHLLCAIWGVARHLRLSTIDPEPMAT